MPNTEKRLVIAGPASLLKEISRFCREVYKRTYGPGLWEERFAQLRFTDAVDLWAAGLPHSSNLPAPTLH